MKLEKASPTAIRYACLNFHYAKRMPAPPCIGWSVFENNEWCGVVVFNAGIGNVNMPFKLAKGEVAELVRVALNGKQKVTSQAVAIAIKLFCKSSPLVKMLVSYADSDEGHYGTIYQAMNWVYVGSKHTGDKFIDPKTGKDVHSRSFSNTGIVRQFGEVKHVKKSSEMIRIKKGLKHKYLYPLTNEMRALAESLRKPFPKRTEHENNASAVQAEEGGAVPTCALQS